MNFVALRQDLASGVGIVRALTHGVSQADAVLKPHAQSWSILEVVCHLYDEEREDFRRRLDVMLHHPGETWTPIHPGVWVTERSYNTRVLSEMLDAFEAERIRSLHWLDGLKHPNWEQESPAPWGSMKAGEMFAAWVAHDTLHFRQIVELRYGRVLRLVEPYGVLYAGEW